MDKKLVIVINGRSGVGKASLIGIAAKQFATRDVSSVDQVRRVAAAAGWNGQKDIPGRQLLSDLKQAMVAYDDSPHKTMMQDYKVFKSGGEQLMFAHIREPREIEKFVADVKTEGGNIITVLVTRETADRMKLAQDEKLAEFPYNFVFKNDKTLEDSGAEFVELIKRYL